MPGLGNVQWVVREVVRGVVLMPRVRDVQRMVSVVRMVVEAGNVCVVASMVGVAVVV